MADKMISVIGTVASRLPDLSIKDAQLIFIKDKHKIALDLGGKRTFYNDIEVLESDQDRQDMLAPVNGCFYFVIKTAVLWFYQDKWIQVTTPPEQILFIDTELPELGVENKLYVNKEQKNIKIWDDTLKAFVIVGEAIRGISESDIDKLF